MGAAGEPIITRLGEGIIKLYVANVVATHVAAYVAIDVAAYVAVRPTRPTAFQPRPTAQARKNPQRASPGGLIRRLPRRRGINEKRGGRIAPSPIGVTLRSRRLPTRRRRSRPIRRNRRDRRSDRHSWLVRAGASPLRSTCRGTSRARRRRGLRTSP